MWLVNRGQAGSRGNPPGGGGIRDLQDLIPGRRERSTWSTRNGSNKTANTILQVGRLQRRHDRATRCDAQSSVRYYACPRFNVFFIANVVCLGVESTTGAVVEGPSEGATGEGMEDGIQPHRTRAVCTTVSLCQTSTGKGRGEGRSGPSVVGMLDCMLARWCVRLASLVFLVYFSFLKRIVYRSCVCAV